MPYGRQRPRLTRSGQRPVSIPHMGCMPYGPETYCREGSIVEQFQSLIWVACPTGHRRYLTGASWSGRFQSLIWVACPTGRDRSTPCMIGYQFQSLIWVACPTGIATSGCQPTARVPSNVSFNPSYGLHALRARTGQPHLAYQAEFQSLIWVACPTGRMCNRVGRSDSFVSIPHMGCMPYGQALRQAHSVAYEFQSLIWVACPTGARARSYKVSNRMFQSLIWVACPTGPLGAPASASGSAVSIPHMGCMPYGLQHFSLSKP